MASSLFEDPSLKFYLFSGHPPSAVDCHRPTSVADRDFYLSPPRLPPQGPCPSSCLYTKDSADLEAKCFLTWNRVLKEMIVSPIYPLASPVMTLNHVTHAERLPLEVRLMSLPLLTTPRGTDPAIPHTARRQRLTHLFLDFPPLTVLLSATSHIGQNFRFPKGQKHVTCTFWACLSGCE